MTTTTRAFFYVQQVEQLVRHRLDECLRSEAITAGQYLALHLIVHHEPVSSAYLARVANISAQAMGEFVKALEVAGFVQRKGDPDNKRVIHIRSTAAGRKALVRCEARVDQAEREFFQSLSGEELAQLRILLGRVRTAERERIAS